MSACPRKVFERSSVFERGRRFFVIDPSTHRHCVTRTVIIHGLVRTSEFKEKIDRNPSAELRREGFGHTSVL